MALFDSIVPNMFSLMYTKMIKKSDSVRKQIYLNFRAFYDGDYYAIKVILEQIIRKIKMFKEKKIDKEEIFIQHLDLIKKAVKRRTAGILDEAPTITLVNDKKEASTENDYFNKLLDKMKFFKKIKEAFRKADFFKIVLMYVVWKENQLKLEVLTPDMFHVQSKNDYNEIDKLGLQRLRNKKDGTGEIYFSIWSEKEHYLVDATGKKEFLPDNEKGINPYEIIPVGILRLEEGTDFYPEPNWSLYLNQIAQDLKLTGHDYAEIFQSNPFYLATNLNIDDDEGIDPTKFIFVKHKDKEITAPDLKAVKPEYDGDKMLGNIQKRNEMVYSSEGLPASSSSIDTKPMSGSAKTIDELEVQENRNDMKEALYYFILDLIQVIRKVHNVPPDGAKIEKIDDSYEVLLKLSDEKIYESIDDKTKRTEFEKANFIKDEIDIVMEELEITEDEAIKHINARKERASKIKPDVVPEGGNLNEKKPNPEDNKDTQK